MDFLSAHKSDLMLSRKTLTMRKFYAFKIVAKPNRDVAESLSWIKWKYCQQRRLWYQIMLGGVINRKGIGFLEADSKCLHAKGLLVGKALVDSNGTHRKPI